MATGKPRGRPPKPTAQKIAEGNKGKRKLPTTLLALPKADQEIPEPPKNLQGDGLEMWNRIWTAGKIWLDPQADYYTAKQACEKYTTAEMYRKGLEAGIYPEFYTLPNGTILPHPATGTMNKALEMMNVALSQLAFNPSARARLEISLQDSQDPLVAMMANSEKRKAEQIEALKKAKENRDG